MGRSVGGTSLGFSMDRFDGRSIKEGRMTVIKPNGDIVGEVFLDQVPLRSKDLRPAWKQFKGEELKPENYQLPDRIKGGIPAAGGRIKNDPGYLTKGKGTKAKIKAKVKGFRGGPHVKFGCTKHKLKFTSTRPFLARFTLKFQHLVLRAVERYLLSGK